MKYLESLLLLVHVIAGFSVLASGLLAFAFRKGSKKHVLSGSIFSIGMYIVAFTAIGICLIFRFNLFLLILGIFSFYLTYTGSTVIQRKQPGQETFFDKGLASFTFVAGLVMMAYGLSIGIRAAAFHPMVILCAVFGGLTAKNAWDDIQMFRGITDRSDKQWWLYYHIGRMGGAYIAASTAFLVFGARSVIGQHPYSWIVWLLPTIIISPLLSLVIRKIKQKRTTSSYPQKTSALASAE